MTLLFDSRDSLLGGPGVVIPGEPFEVIRDWVGHTGEDFEIQGPLDFKWDSVDHVAGAKLPGPYDVDNQIYYIQGTAALFADVSLLIFNPEPIFEIAAWVKFDDVPTPPSVDFEMSFFRMVDVDTDDFFEIFFVFKTDNTVQLKCVFGDLVTTVDATHPDDMARTGWLFFSAQFDHTSGPGDTIRMDPGNDNLQGFDPGPRIGTTTYDEIYVLGGAGQSPSDTKGIRFANILGLRVVPDVGTDTDVIFSVPGPFVFQVPAGVFSLVATIWAAGAGGGGGGSASVGGWGEGGGYTKATHVVSPGEFLDVDVGGGGGFGFAGSVSGDGGGGGGFSRLERVGVPLQFASAGAGGGGGDNSSAVPGGRGGSSGGTTGGDGATSGAALAGKGGTPVAGGAGGVGGTTGENGGSEFGGRGARGEVGLGGGGPGGTGGGGDGGSQSTATPGFGGGGGGGSGLFGGGGGGSSTFGNAGGAGGGGGSSFIDPVATAPVDEPSFPISHPGGQSDPLYVVPVGEGGDSGPILTNGGDGADGRVVLSYMGAGGSWRANVRGFSTQAEFDQYQIEVIKAVRVYRTSEYDLGGSLGDRFIHDISGFLNAGSAPAGALNRNTANGPLDTDNSYLYTENCVATTINVTKSLWYAPFDEWDLTWFCFFKQPVSVVQDGDWFIRFENDVGENIRLERVGTILSRHIDFASGPPVVESTGATPLFDGFWHRLVMTAHNSVAANWDVAVDGTRYFSDVTPVALSAPITKVRWGNIDVDLAVMGWAQYFDAEIYTTFTSQATEAAVRTYMETRSDIPPGTATSDYYAGYYPQQSMETGVVI